MSNGHEPDKTPGRFSWNELITSDPEKAKAFYSTVFGWTADTMPMPNGGEYVMFKQGEMPVCGMMKKPDEMGDVPSHWMGYITVADVDGACADAVKAGGNVLCPVMEIPEMGKLAAVQDPTGAVFSFWEFS